MTLRYKCEACNDRGFFLSPDPRHPRFACQDCMMGKFAHQNGLPYLEPVKPELMPKKKKSWEDICPSK